MATSKCLPAFFPTGRLLSASGLLGNVEYSRLPHKAGSHQLLESRLQHCTSCDIKNSVKVRAHEVYAVIA